MFNHYFFDGLNATSLYEQFLKDGKTGLAVVIDPPFGGKVEVISHTIKAINNDYKRVNGNNAAQVSSIFFFPPLRITLLFIYLMKYRLLGLSVFHGTSNSTGTAQLRHARLQS